MSDVSANENRAGPLRLAPDPTPESGPDKSGRDAHAPIAPLDGIAPKTVAVVHPAQMTVTSGPGMDPARAPRPAILIFGMAILMIGVVLATLPIRTWTNLVLTLSTGTAVAEPTEGATGTLTLPDPLPAFVRHLSSETGRWMASGLLVIAALSVLRARAFAVIVTGALFALTVFSCDSLLAGRFSRVATAWLGAGSPRYVLAILAAAFGYLVHASPANSKISIRGIIGLLIVAVAGFGTMHNWYDWTPLASRIGPTASQLLSEWTDECTWATVLILTAIGVASSRTRPVHLLIAFMLIALAWHCVSSGLVQVRTFPELAVQDYVPTVEDVNYRNVEAWRWVVAVELAVLAAVLLHLSLGMGALNVAFAFTWMIAGLGIYGAVGNMSLLRTASEGFTVTRSTGMQSTQASQDPLANWGLPIGPAPQPTAAPTPTQRLRPNPNEPVNDEPAPRGEDSTVGGTAARNTSAVARPSGTPDVTGELDEARMRALASIQRPATVREITPLVWMFLTAALAGLIAVTGVSMMTSSRSLRRFAFCVLWVSLGIAGTLLWSVWPKGSETWLGWLAAWRYSQHHTSAIWLTFLGSAAIFGFWALRHDSNLATWVHASAAAVLLATCLTLGGVAILIYWGGFPALPTWVYIVIAAGQSSLMWALLMHQSLAERRARRLA